MDTLNAQAANWALTHVSRYGDTDLFPVPFEFDAIRSFWLDVSAFLTSIDFATHEAAPSLRLLIPKARQGFRVGTQLDPYDSLLYLGMIFEAAGAVEAFRTDPARRIACSYRVEITPEGQLFRGTNGWPDFHARSGVLSEQFRDGFVLTADISDFYTQIYQHRVQSSLEAAGIELQRTQNIAKFLATITAKQSRGVPVGPAASTILAEACLADVDNFLLRKGYQHTRYVDDFRIFVPDRAVAVRALYDLTEYLSSAHRLSLQGAKTRVLETSKFVTTELIDPEQRELQERMSRVDALLGDVGAASWYDEPVEVEITPEIENEAARDTIRVLFREVVQQEGLNLNFARYLLRRARALRTRGLLPDVLANLHRLLAILRDVVRYLIVVYPRDNPRPVGAALVELLRASDFRHVPFVQLWVLHALAEVPALCPADEALRLAEESHPIIRDRCAALIARAHRIVDWVRERKETWGNVGPWAQRAILWSGSILPSEERRHWLEPVMATGEHINAVVAKAANRGVGSAPASS